MEEIYTNPTNNFFAIIYGTEFENSYKIENKKSYTSSKAYNQRIKLQ